jgi:hypothetical protein
MNIELTKEQVQYIDRRLENEGVIYWDVRIELLDHVVSDIEKRTNLAEKFEDAIYPSFVSLGFNGSFKSLVELRKKLFIKLNKKIIKTFFRSSKTICIYILFLAACYIFVDKKWLGQIFLIAFLAVFCLVPVFSLFNYKKVFKSASLFGSFSFQSFLLSLLNCALFFPKFFGIEKLSTIYFSILIAVLFCLIYTGYKTFLDSYLKTNRMYLKLMEE